MNEGEGGLGVSGATSPYMTRAECKLMSEKVEMQIHSVNENITSNTASIDKLNKTLLGNGDDGLILTVNRLMWKNQLIDKGTSIIIAILSSVATAYIMRLLS